jgi:hypothetical protein
VCHPTRRAEEYRALVDHQSRLQPGKTTAATPGDERRVRSGSQLGPASFARKYEEARFSEPIADYEALRG